MLFQGLGGRWFMKKKPLAKNLLTLSLYTLCNETDDRFIYKLRYMYLVSYFGEQSMNCVRWFRLEYSSIDEHDLEFIFNIFYVLTSCLGRRTGFHFLLYTCLIVNSVGSADDDLHGSEFRRYAILLIYFSVVFSMRQTWVDILQYYRLDVLGLSWILAFKVKVSIGIT